MNCRIASMVVALAGLMVLPAAVPGVTTPPRPNPMASQIKAVADARLKVEKARLVVLAIRRKVEATFANKPDWKAARDAMEAAKSEYEAAGRKVIAGLESTATYKALAATRDKTQGVMDAYGTTPPAGSEDAPKITDEDFAKASKDHQTAVLAMKQMEKDVMDQDATYAVIKQKYRDTQATWEALETQVDDAVKLEPTYPPAQQAFEQAETALKSAQEQLEAARKAAAAAAAAAAASKAKTPPRR